MGVKKEIYRLFIDQYGEKIFARTVKELCKKAGRTKAKRMYIDTEKNGTLHIGYVVGRRWFTEYMPVRRKIKEKRLHGCTQMELFEREKRYER